MVPECLICVYGKVKIERQSENPVTILFSGDDGVSLSWYRRCLRIALVCIIFTYIYIYISQMFDVTGVVSASVLTLSGPRNYSNHNNDLI